MFPTCSTWSSPHIPYSFLILHYLLQVIHRRKVFEDNLRYIESHNKLASLGRHTFTLGVNKFADLTVEEFQGYVERGGFIRGKESKKAATKFHSQGSDPDAVDWREKVSDFKMTISSLKKTP